MNPQFEQSQGLRLPEPSRHSAQSDHAQENPHENGYEADMSLPEKQNASPPATLTNFPQPDPQSSSQISDDADDVIDMDEGETDDTAIDEEWINKAKEIVDQTKNDPYLQSTQISKFKAEYLKTRHDKVIKTVEDKKK